MRESSLHRHSRQRGAALLLMLLLMIVGAAALFVNNLSSRTMAGALSEDNSSVLAEAKAALVAYAVTRHDFGAGIGLLPCPDLNTSGTFVEGEAHDTSCGAQYVSAVGRLPWKTLGMPAVRDRNGECLWYAVSGLHKDAPGARSELLNPDSAGLLEIFAADGVTFIAGGSPEQRAVAVVMAPGAAIAGQNRTSLGSGVDLCGGNYTATNYLDNNGGAPFSMSGTADTVDQIVTGGSSGNDQALVITRADLDAAIQARADLTSELRDLTQAVAQCVADYGLKNTGAPADKRLPWPSPPALINYRSDAFYRDLGVGTLSGRLADDAFFSNMSTANPVARVLTACDTGAVPGWTAARQALWRDWKDHFFYAVAEEFSPTSTMPNVCTNCLTVNGAGAWASVIVFAGHRLAGSGQLRREPPTDADTKGQFGNYLEGRNALNYPFVSGTVDFESAAAGPVFNDVLFCIDANLVVSAC